MKREGFFRESPFVKNSAGKAMHRVKSPNFAEDAPQPITVHDPGIAARDIHHNVHFICRRLQDKGHTALLVGGAVRDLLLGRPPKDFDLATSAHPDAVKRLFKNARIIGRRFRLVLIRYPTTTIEISTFRGESSDKKGGMIHRDNRFGPWEEDMMRRDFTINALFYDPIAKSLYHPPRALEDLEKRIIRTIKSPAASFTEDPVRMLRAARFKVQLGLNIESSALKAIAEVKDRLDQVSRHRLADQIQRLLVGGGAFEIFRELDRLGLLTGLLESRRHRWFFASQVRQHPMARLTPFLRRMDQWGNIHSEPIPPTVALLGLLWTLSDDPQRHRLAGNDSGKSGDYLGKLAGMLAEWGLLNGQVAPALIILGRARVLARESGRGASISFSHIQGNREAILLLAILAGEISMDDNFLAAGLAALPSLPDLPILDHPRPASVVLAAKKRRKGRFTHPKSPSSKRRRTSRRRQSPQNLS